MEPSEGIPVVGSPRGLMELGKWALLSSVV